MLVFYTYMYSAPYMNWYGIALVYEDLSDFLIFNNGWKENSDYIEWTRQYKNGPIITEEKVYNNNPDFVRWRNRHKGYQKCSPTNPE